MTENDERPSIRLLMYERNKGIIEGEVFLAYCIYK